MNHLPRAIPTLFFPQEPFESFGSLGFELAGICECLFFESFGSLGFEMAGICVFCFSFESLGSLGLGLAGIYIA